MSWGFELIDVEKAYGDRLALRGLDLGAPMGCVTALVGPAQAGKTTAFRLLAGLERPDVGAVLVGGKEISRLRGTKLAHLQRRMAVVFAGGVDEAHGLFGTVSARENVEFGMRAAGRVPRRRLEQVAQEELERFGLAAVQDHLPAQLSVAQRKCLALARAVALRSPLVLVDGLETGLTGRTLGAVCALVREECHRHGATWLITTREQAVADAAADHRVHVHASASSAVMRR